MPASDVNRTIDAVWRIESARLIAGLARLVRDVGLAEDLAQEALVAALEQWPESGVPDNPGAWLMATAKHRAIDLLRRNARLERKHAESGRDVKGELRKAGFRKELIAANVRRLEKLVRGLEWKAGKTEWSDDGATTSYADEDARRKEGFARAVVARRAWGLVWDLGCNEGRFSQLAAENARYVVSVDADAAVVDRLYRELAAEGKTTILPLVGDVTDPSPALGWGGRERLPLEERGRPELTLCLAVLHHIAISGNVPVPQFLSWLRELGTELVIEFPTRDDPRVAALLARKRQGAHPDYDLEPFTRALEERFEVERREELAAGTRILFHARPR